MSKSTLAFVLALILFLPLVSADCFGSWSMMGGYGVFGGIMWLFGMLFMTLLIVAIILLIFWLVRQLNKTEKHRR